MLNMTVVAQLLYYRVIKGAIVTTKTDASDACCTTAGAKDNTAKALNACFL